MKKKTTKLMIGTVGGLATLFAGYSFAFNSLLGSSLPSYVGLAVGGVLIVGTVWHFGKKFTK